MTVFSKLNKNPNMWMFDNLFPPFGLTSFISAVVICVLSLYMFKKLGTDGNVPVRDSTKNHSWTPIKITSKVRTVSQKYKSHQFIFNVLGMELLYM